MSKTERYVIFPDCQVPGHDQKMWNYFVDFVKEYKPDKIVSVGDFTDSTELSRWVSGTKGEYTGKLQAAFDKANSMLVQLREVYSGPLQMCDSNHDRRLELYLERKAPALEGLRDLTIEKQLRFDEVGMEYVKGFVPIAPGWGVFHGDQGNLSGIPGQTAMKLAQKTGLNVICGHTHRAGIVAESTGHSGRVSTRWGMEVGHFMDMASPEAKYLKTGAGNWQRGFGILYRHGTTIQPSLVIPNAQRRFCVEGQWFGPKF